MPTSSTESKLAKGRRLQYATIAYNMGEAVVSIVAGAHAGSASLVGFGLDSVIEVASGGAVLGRLGGRIGERTALRIVGYCFLALAGYVAVECGGALWNHETPEKSIAGIVLACLSVVVMPLLARAKRRVAAQVGSGAMHADSRQTDFCAYLSAILLVGLILNAVWGWWWADPVAGLIMAPIIAREGLGALRNRSCCCH